jgi:TonB-dependent starch-binding outer membrane protein SusC
MKKDFDLWEYSYPSLKKLIMKLKITFLIILISVSNVLAIPSYSQVAKVSLNMENKSLEQVMDKIEGQTEFYFIFNQKQIDVKRIVSIQANNELITDILPELFKGVNVNYLVVNRKILLTTDPIENSLLNITSADEPQQKQVKGTVTDEKGNTLAGVTISVKGTTLGTLTDAEGKYTISNVDMNAMLVFSFVGMTPQEISLSGRSSLDVVMVEQAIGLNEVVVIGYGTSKIKDLTSAISTVKAENLEKSGVDANIDMMLVGRVPGLNMTMNSAQPGSNVNINIRGSISPNGNNSPLYVIDGVAITSNSSNIADVSGSGNVPLKTGLDQSPLNTINPNDIQTINVLKDASAAAIYGSAAANGVIIITTKRGTAGGLKISYEGSHTLSYRKSYKDHLYNAQSFMKYQNLFYHERQAVTNNAYPYRSATGFTDYNKDGLTDINDYSAAYNSVTDQYSASDIANAKNFDWIKYIMDDAWVAEHNLSISGGSEKSKYFASYNYYYNDGLLKKSNLERNNFRFNFDQNLAKWLDFNVSFNYSLINTDNESSGDIVSSTGVGTTVTGAFSMTPYIDDSIDPATGKYTLGLNAQLTSPAGQLTYLDHTKNQRFFASPNLTFKLAKGLTFKVVQGYDSQFSHRNHYIPVIAGKYNAPDGQATITYSETVNSSTEGYFNLNKTIGEHSIDAVLGAGYYFTSAQSEIAQSSGYFTDSFLTDKLQAGSTQSQRYTGSAHTETTKLSQFGRLSYTYKDRYTLLGTIRRDGSSYFAENHKWGVFPSISGAWRISEEDWAKIEGLSNLKLRVGYGTAGNEPMSANSLAVYSADELTGGGATVAYGLITQGGYLGGVQISTAANPNLKWETDKTVDFGFDFGLFKQKISGSLDYFVRTAEDLLDYKNLPSNGMVNSVIANIGSTQAKGWEFVISTQNISKPKFMWSTDFNFSYTKYSWKTRNPDLVLNSWVPVNADMSAVYGWETDGIFKSYDEINAYKNADGVLLQPLAMPGNIKYVDSNGDGVLDDKDNHLLGLSTAPWRFGLNNTLQYKNISLTFYFYGAAGGVKSRGDGSTLLGATTGQNNGWSDNIDKYYTVFNPDGDWPGLGSDLTSQTQRTGGSSDFWLMKGDYLKLKYLTLNYNFSKDIVSKLKLASLGVSVTAQNLLTFTGYKGYDPEVSINSYPLCNSFTIGVKASF